MAYNSSGLYTFGLVTLQCNNFYNPDGYNYGGDTDPGYGIQLQPGASDISADPKLVSYVYGDFHIQPGSPCIDAGSNGAAALDAYDIDGQPRILPSGGTIDIGADESDGAVRNVVPMIVRVDGEDGNDSNDGSSWAAAKKTVQSAIEAVTENVKHSETAPVFN